MTTVCDALDRSGCRGELERPLNDALQNVKRWVLIKWDLTVDSNKWISQSWQGKNTVILDIEFRGPDKKIRNVYLGLFELIEYSPSEKKFYPLTQMEIESRIKDRIAICLRDRFSARL